MEPGGEKPPSGLPSADKQGRLSAALHQSSHWPSALPAHWRPGGCDGGFRIGRARREASARADSPVSPSARIAIRARSTRLNGAAKGEEYAPIRRPSVAARSLRTLEVSLHFGVTCEAAPLRWGPVRMPLAPGSVTVITGPSGTGKTTLLSAIAARHAEARNVAKTVFPTHRSVLDCVAAGAPLATAVSLLSRCAMGEPGLWLRAYDELSEGEKFRARLARTIGLLVQSGGGMLLCDEFASMLHRRAALAIAFNLRHLASRDGLAIVLATVTTDILADLRPDVVVHMGPQPVVSQGCHSSGRPFSLRRRMVIEPGGKKDYEQFATMHYRGARELGFVDKVFVMRQRDTGETLGVIVYSHGNAELSLRNRATGGRFVRNLPRLNRELRVLRRLVIHPDVRGCGLGKWLVRRTLPMAGVPYVECLARMGWVNPVFEKAGMKRIGVCRPPPHQAECLATLRRLRADPFAAGFVAEVSRRPSLRRIVREFVRRWYKSTTALGADRVERQSPEFLALTFRTLIGSRPVYYLWQADGAAAPIGKSEECAVESCGE